MKNIIISSIYFIGLLLNFNVINSAQEDKASAFKKFYTIKAIEAYVRQFLDKIDHIKDTASALKDQYNCVKKDRDLAKCSQIGCSTTKECLHTIFAQFQKVLDPILLNLVGTVKGGELKPGAVTALPLLWSEPRPDKVKTMQNILVNNIAVNINDMYNFFGLMNKSLDPNLSLEEKKDTVPVAVQDPAHPDQGTPPPDQSAQPSSEQPTDQVVKKKKRRKKKKKAAAETAATDSSTPDATQQPPTPAPS